MSYLKQKVIDNRKELIALIPKNNPSHTLIISLLSTPTSLLEILNYNPIILTALIDQPLDKQISSIIYNLLNKVHFQPVHLKLLKSKINTLEEEFYIKIGFFVSPPNFLKKLSKSKLDFLTINEIYKFREFIYLAKKDAKFYKNLYLHKLFKKDRLRILQLVEDKKELVLLRKFSKEQVDYIYTLRNQLPSKCILPLIEYKIKKGIIGNYKYKKRYLMIVHKKLGITKLNLDFEYQMEYEGNLLLNQYRNNKEEFINNYKIDKEGEFNNKEEFINNKEEEEFINNDKIDNDKIDKEDFNNNDKIDNDKIDNDKIDNDKIDNDKIDNDKIDKEKFINNNKINDKLVKKELLDKEIEEFLTKNINGYVKYILFFIRYTGKYNYLLQINNTEKISLLIKEDIVNDKIAKETAKITNNDELIMEIIEMGYDIIEELFIRKKYDFLSLQPKEFLIKHLELIFNAEKSNLSRELFKNEDLIQNLLIKLPRSDTVFILLLKFISKNPDFDYLFEICKLYLDNSKFVSFYIKLCLLNNKVPYNIMKYPINRDKVMLHFINDKKLFFEYLNYDFNIKILFKMLSKGVLLEDVYRILIRFPTRKICNILKSKLKRVKYTFDYREIYLILEILIEYKSKVVIEGIIKELVECIEIDKEMNILIREVLLIYFR